MEPNIKKYLGVSIIIGVVTIAFAALSYGVFFALNSYDTLGAYYSRTFQVTAEGKAVTVPDVAKFTASIVTEGGKDLNAIQTKNTENANKVIEFVKAQGVDTKDVKTVNYDISPKYPYYNCQSSICPAPEISGYTVNQAVEIKIRDLAKTGNILGGVVKNGANSVSQLSFIVDNPEKAESEARAEALKKAKEKAVAMARAGGFEIGEITSIYDNAPNFPYDTYGYGGLEAGAFAKSVAPQVEPGSQEIKISVTITYEIR